MDDRDLSQQPPPAPHPKASLEQALFYFAHKLIERGTVFDLKALANQRDLTVHLALAADLKANPDYWWETAELSAHASLEAAGEEESAASAYAGAVLWHLALARAMNE
jgi:hypothetical protein